MDKIIDIQRKAGVARVTLLSGDTLKIPSPLFLERRLRVGEAIDPESYRLFMEKRGYHHAIEAAMKFLALRDRSMGEVRSRLKRSCYDEGTIEKVLAALANHQLISDSRFAESWAYSRSKKYGKARIAQELRSKGVSRQEAQAALEQISEDDELQRACEQAKKLSRRIDEPQKMLQALIRRGYSFSIARKALENMKKP